jgi:DNA-binding CsgD family transcriptional regulator
VKGIIERLQSEACFLPQVAMAPVGWASSEHPPRPLPRSGLTGGREQQVLELVEQGLKNREIARELGIRPGTVKIHLKHIFEKTGVRGRVGLAINGMKEKALDAADVVRRRAEPMLSFTPWGGAPIIRFASVGGAEGVRGDAQAGGFREVASAPY